ncbi:MAG: hypothetical protein JWQ90_1689 [Hydrocarboniphaga sp.]|uniref:OmpA family protein n=1 Tax=Hydrocarboniphaga sp. TaxID=2033016 RepID=UPI0026142419|nr:OmpA family protein [Hydrocarboniphaga sp.]MDB5969239.1 hypothetical protein [Hydrocarboniphaga sp.]
MKFRSAGIAAGITAGVGGLLAAISMCTPALAQELDSLDSAAKPSETATATDTGTGVLDGRFYISPMFSYLLADGDRLTDDGLGGTLTFGKGITDNLALEISGYYLQADSNTSASSDTAKLYGYGASLLVFPRNQFRNAYGILGVTYDETKDHPGSPSSFNGVGYNAGLGYLLPLGWFGAALRLEALFHLDSHNEENAGAGGKSEFYDGLFNAGLFIPIGAKPVVAAAPTEPVAVVAPIVSVDSDGDGVPDDRDQCPGTPQGTPVDSVGCPLKPPCPTPAAGERLTLEGCAAGDVVVLQGVTFDFDKATLTVNARTILDGVSDSLQSVPAIKVELGGHTDSVGTDAYNLKLSDRRATTVREYLIGRGVDGARMSSHGYGEAQPVADNSTDEGRELNRRVELKIQAQ